MRRAPSLDAAGAPLPPPPFRCPMLYSSHAAPMSVTCAACSKRFVKVVTGCCKEPPKLEVQARMFRYMCAQSVIDGNSQDVKDMKNANRRPVMSFDEVLLTRGAALASGSGAVKRRRMGDATHKGGPDPPQRPWYLGTSLLLVRMDSGGGSCERTTVVCVRRTGLCTALGLPSSVVVRSHVVATPLPSPTSPRRLTSPAAPLCHLRPCRHVGGACSSRQTRVELVGLRRVLRGATAASLRVRWRTRRRLCSAAEA